MKIPFVNLPAQFASDRDGIMADIEAVFTRGDFIGGAAVGEFETAAAAFHDVPHAIALNSGTDALILALYALGIGHGDEVITPPNSFVASTAAIVHVGATPVFADVLDDQNMDPVCIERALSPRTRAIMPVHLTGRMARMDQIMEIARRKGISVVEDAAQSVGSKLGGRLAGTIGDVGCFSTHPLKNLNAAGDAGFILTRDAELAGKVRDFRNHGLVDRNTVNRFGSVSRMDTLQAAILKRRLHQLPDVIARRRDNAELYRKHLNPDAAFIAPCQADEFNTFHTFVVQVERRDALQQFLTASGVGTAIHYPVPIHLQPAAHHLGYGAGSMPKTEAQASRILSLPIHQYLDPVDIKHVCALINGF